MSIGCKEEVREDQQKVMAKKSSATTADSPPMEPHHTGQTSSDSEQGATGVNVPIRPLTTISSSLDNIPPSPPTTDWEFVHLADALPSLTSAPSIATATQSNDAPEDEKSYDLTQSTLLLFNESQDQDVGAKASMEAKKGTATRASDDSDEPMGSYAPADGDSAEPFISATGSWADEIPRTAADLEDEFARL